jgi:type III pantothenate kinase
VLLAVDVGNTSSVIGLFDGEALAAEWRIATRYRTTDELDVTLRGLLASRSIDASLITAGCLSTTVPPVQQAWEEVLQRVAGVEPITVGPGVKTGVAVRVQNPREVGPDRIANAAAAAATPRCRLPLPTTATGTAESAVGSSPVPSPASPDPPAVARAGQASTMAPADA